ncbi:MAG TPA: glycosyltransferase family A protein [Gaiellaceae bacterium]|nr:glycosyltransferase family A protein [Gaiellaceae bacterium]
MPDLSAVVISRDDEEVIERTVRSVVEQESPWPFEVIVVTSGSDRTAEIVRDRFPEVTVVELPRPALPGEARNAGLRAALGTYVSFPGSHVELPPGSLAARIAAHRLGHTMVTGTTLNGTRTLAGWAAYFLDNSTVLPGRPSTVLEGPPAHCSYTRAALLAVGGFPEHLRAGEDTVVNHELARRGHTAFRAQEVRLIHHTPCRTRRGLIAHYFVRGRSSGRILFEARRTDGQFLHLHSARAARRLRAHDGRTVVGRHVEAWGDLEERRAYRRARKWIGAAWAAHRLGACLELARPRRAGAFVLFGKPVVTLATGSGFARVDVVTRRVKLVHSPVVPEEIARDGRIERWTRPGAPWRAEASLACRLTLAWAALVIRGAEEQALEAHELDAIERHLDTRGPERATSETPVPPLPVVPR